VPPAIDNPGGGKQPDLMEIRTASRVDGPRFGLAQDDWELICAVMRRTGVSARNHPVVFGSRATGQARRYSDLDIGLAGEPLGQEQLAQLTDELEESDLPVRVDVVNLTTAGERLREHALQGAVALELAVVEQA
jgi:predicted nucleotidyltransferase